MRADWESLGAGWEEFFVRLTLTSFDCGSEGLVLISSRDKGGKIWHCSTLDQACHLVKYIYEKKYEMQGRRAKIANPPYTRELVICVDKSSSDVGGKSFSR